MANDLTVRQHVEAARLEISSHLKPYLQDLGWHRLDGQVGSELWVGRKGELVLRVVIPTEEAADDIPVLLDALKVIAFATDKSMFEVTADLSHGGADVVSVRIPTREDVGSAPLTVAHAAVAGLRKLVIGSAAGKDGLTAVLPSRRPRAERYANDVQLTTSAGSFVLVAVLPLYESGGEAVDDPQLRMDTSLDIEKVPYGREVARRIQLVAETATALASLVDHGAEDLTVFEADPGQSGNATELEGLSALGGPNHLAYKVRFVESPIVDGAHRAAVLEVTSSQQELFASAARLLRDRRPKDDVTIRGKVVRLFREGPSGPGEVVVRGREPDGAIEHRYRLKLTEAQYHEAIVAHDQSSEVAVRGTLVVNGNFLTLEETRWFTTQLGIARYQT